MNKKDIDSLNKYFNMINQNELINSKSYEFEIISEEDDINIQTLLNKYQISIYDDIRFKNLPLQKQYKLIEYILTIDRYDYVHNYDDFVYLIFELYDNNKIPEEIFRLIFNTINYFSHFKMVAHYANSFSYEIWEWLLYKHLGYFKYFNFKNSKIKKQVKELYEFLTV
jgi:hypothetical protein